MSMPQVHVCVCLEEVEHGVIPLQEIAAGHVFGPQQQLKVTLHGQDKEALYDLASSIQECCFHLVNEVSVAPTNPMQYDVALVILSPNKSPIDGQSQRSSKDTTNPRAHFLGIVSNALSDSCKEHTKLIVLGPSSNAVASILSHDLGFPGGNQVLSFQPHQNATGNEHKGRNETRGQYWTSHSLCQVVSNWWTGNKSKSSGLTAGIKFIDRKNFTSTPNGGMFFSVPVDIVGEKTFKVSPSRYINQDEVKQELHETETAIKGMRLSDYQDKRCSSIVHAQL